MAACMVRLFSSRLLTKGSKLGQNAPDFLIACNRASLCGRRTLFSSEILGLENYSRQRASLVERMGDTRNKFSERMDEYTKAEGNHTIFTDDLKTMVYMAESDKELDTTISMVRRFHLQNNDLKFSSFVFGPLVIRLLHVLNKPDLSFELFMDKTLAGFFDQHTSCIIIMDQLYEAKKYPLVLTAFKSIKDRQLGRFKYPMDCVTLAVATHYQLNTGDSLQCVTDLLKEVKSSDESGTGFTMRATVYAAALALKQKKPDVALEMLSLVTLAPNRGMPVAYTNVKALVYVGLGRIEEAIQILNSIVQRDVPEYVTVRGDEIFDEVLTSLKEAVQKHGDKELQHKLDTVERSLRQGGHIAQQKLDEYLNRPILRQRKFQDGYKQRDRPPRWDDRASTSDTGAPERKFQDGYKQRDRPPRWDDRASTSDTDAPERMPRKEWSPRGEARLDRAPRGEESQGRPPRRYERTDRRDTTNSNGNPRFTRPGLYDRT